jgi:SET domain-containing protein
MVGECGDGGVRRWRGRVGAELCRNPKPTKGCSDDDDEEEEEEEDEDDDDV